MTVNRTVNRSLVLLCYEIHTQLVVGSCDL